MTAQAPAPGHRRRGIRRWADRGRALWWALSGRDRIGIQGLLLVAGLQAGAWRARQVGFVQVDFALTVLTLLAMLAAFFRAAVYRPEAAAGPVGPVVTRSEEVQRHAASEAGLGEPPEAPTHIWRVQRRTSLLTKLPL
ncbi:hypothetical protein [Streptomyces erythrochromogenes]|uniref:hypothetical protein n=1 Tax=Streptomyces erythrochromogenes TaxID=285574 RepID=UPI00382E1413